MENIIQQDRYPCLIVEEEKRTYDADLKDAIWKWREVLATTS